LEDMNISIFLLIIQIIFLVISLGLLAYSLYLSWYDRNKF